MISIITCSINPEYQSQLKENIERTIGVPFEYIPFDNRELKYGITRVYNICAEKAIYPNLCFIHEDVKINTPEWGKIIIDKLKEDNTGVIGFAGGTAKLKPCSGWVSLPQFIRQHLIQHVDGEKIPVDENPDKEDFSQVICIDGCCLFSTKKVWKENKFDEENIKGFHIYDLDFSLRISQSKSNYVCNLIDLEHYSVGNFSKEWFDDTISFHNRWSDVLPVYVNTPTLKKQKSQERISERFFIATLMDNKIGDWGYIRKLMINYFIKHPISKKTFILIRQYYDYKRKWIEHGIMQK